MLYAILERLVITVKNKLTPSGLFLIFNDSNSKLPFSCKPPGSEVFEPSVDC